MAFEEVTRSYIDNFSVKDFAMNKLIPIYFNDEDVSDRTVGSIGYTTELMSHIAEDAFNVGSVLFRESFPNRAEIPESIYSHAAVFQLSDVLARAASCKFILVMNEDSIIKNMQLVSTGVGVYGNSDATVGSIYRFYIDKDTTITVEDIDYCLDYDVQLSIIEKVTEDGKEYIFTGRYLMPGYENESSTLVYRNSISDLIDPYIKIRRSGDKFLAIEVQAHQMFREEDEAEITSNTLVSYSTIDCGFIGQLAGFDVLYQPPEDNSWYQLDVRVLYSQPSQEPFCYFQMIDDATFRISFNSEDNYFTPEFGAKLKIIKYITDGAAGNFNYYNGTNITIEPCNDNFHYSRAFLTAAKPLGGSLGGMNQGDLDALQNITVENYRTATAITTENDLQEFFNNYKYYYGNSDMLFIKKRNDIFERIFSAFMLVRKEDEYIYHTTTLKMHINIDDMENPEKNIWKLEPGYLFTANEADGYAKFLRDKGKTLEYFQDYKEAVEILQSISNDEFDQYVIDHPSVKHVRYIDDASDYDMVPEYLQRPTSFATFKQRNGLDDKLTVFDISKHDFEELDNPQDLKFLLMNPFLIYFRKNPNTTSVYMTYVHNESLLDFVNINDDSFIQFIASNLNLSREFEKERRYKFSIKLQSNIQVSEDTPIVDCNRDVQGNFLSYKLGDKYNVENNSLRVIVEIKTGVQSLCYTELYPVDFDKETDTFTFMNYVYTDDHLSSNSRLRLLDGIIYRFYTPYTDPDTAITYNTGDYFVMSKNSTSLYDLYDKNGTLRSSDIDVLTVTKYYTLRIVRMFKNVINLSSAHEVLVPMSDCVCKVYMLFNKVIDPETNRLVSSDISNNKFTAYDDYFDDSFDNYFWTNEYETNTYPMDFMKPLNSVRVHVTFDDYTAKIIQNPETINPYNDAVIPDHIDNTVDLTMDELEVDDALVNNEDIDLPYEEGMNGLYYQYYKNVVEDDEKGTMYYDLYRDVVTGNYYKKPGILSSTYTLYDFYENVLATGITQEQLDAKMESGTYLNTLFVHDIMDIELNNVGFIRASMINNYTNLAYFLDSFSGQYDFLVDVIHTRLRNETNLDVKFYRTYGRSRNIVIGEENEILNTVNLSMEFDIWFNRATDIETAIPEVKLFIKRDVEMLNNKGMNNVYISNLIRKIESNFSYVDHIRFVTINQYDSDYQTVRSYYEDINDMKVEERRTYIPEFMTINTEDITINDYFV